MKERPHRYERPLGILGQVAAMGVWVWAFGVQAYAVGMLWNWYVAPTLPPLTAAGAVGLVMLSRVVLMQRPEFAETDYQLWAKFWRALHPVAFVAGGAVARWWI